MFEASVKTVRVQTLDTFRERFPVILNACTFFAFFVFFRVGKTLLQSLGIHPTAKQQRTKQKEKSKIKLVKRDCF